MRRLSLEIKGVRPPLWLPALTAPLGHLRGFRHIFNHAYDLAIDPERLALVVRDAETIVRTLPGACESFVAEVARRNNGRFERIVGVRSGIPAGGHGELKTRRSRRVRPAKTRRGRRVSMKHARCWLAILCSLSHVDAQQA